MDPEGTLSCRNKPTAGFHRSAVAIGMLIGATFLSSLMTKSAAAQALGVLPVTIELAPGQETVSLTILNQGSAETSVQIRGFDWSQASPDGDESLKPTDAIATSPPLATIAPGATQIVRMLLRQPPSDTEATYRILLDQIPAPTVPGDVQVVLRLSIPVFAEPAGRVFPHLIFHIERIHGQAYLVAVNDGGKHEKLSDIALTTNTGTVLSPEGNLSPYILAGAMRRWRIAEPDKLPTDADTLRLTAHTEAGVIDQPVNVLADE